MSCLQNKIHDYLKREMGASNALLTKYDKEVDEVMQEVDETQEYLFHWGVPIDEKYGDMLRKYQLSVTLNNKGDYHALSGSRKNLLNAIDYMLTSGKFDDLKDKLQQEKTNLYSKCQELVHNFEKYKQSREHKESILKYMHEDWTKKMDVLQVLKESETLNYSDQDEVILNLSEHLTIYDGDKEGARILCSFLASSDKWFNVNTSLLKTAGQPPIVVDLLTVEIAKKVKNWKQWDILRSLYRNCDNRTGKLDEILNFQEKQYLDK